LEESAGTARVRPRPWRAQDRIEEDSTRELDAGRRITPLSPTFVNPKDGLVISQTKIVSAYLKPSYIHFLGIPIVEKYPATNAREYHAVP